MENTQQMQKEEIFSGVSWAPFTSVGPLKYPPVGDCIPTLLGNIPKVTVSLPPGEHKCVRHKTRHANIGACAPQNGYEIDRWDVRSDVLRGHFMLFAQSFNDGCRPLQKKLLHVVPKHCLASASLATTGDHARFKGLVGLVSRTASPQ